MKKITIVFALGMSLAFLPVAQTVLSPQPAYAAEMKSAEPSTGDYFLDLLIVRPGAYILLAGAFLTYPIAWLLDPLFGDDPVRLKKNWIDKPYADAIDRPMGNFNWKAR
ncbi:MAG: hypothetical protein HOC91_07950 [Nitrospinaceae bacterium]|jgi:hypothetical protein|nr:hypothetical protein [Nitrospinaceae bacterium]MBT3435528.1 hypothetical protein [Nitrospinaceae bacterium]MBT3820529.1 hypothetical protein [Nitrospinaceae bacterium]MBT4094879.1 hypothetical protein [Nitrospinaceae bacterium]MBT4430430.1 hypothetical protein [Nitrospinaceae bacterium]